MCNYNYITCNCLLIEENIVPDMLNKIFSPMNNLPDGSCHICRKHFQTYQGLEAHVKRDHIGADTSPIVSPSTTDEVYLHTQELLKMLLLKRLLDISIKAGDGETLSLLTKHFMLYFKALGASKYGLAMFEYTAQQLYFLSPKMKLALKQERFVNNQGHLHSNIPMDLELEHSNKFFKTNFRLSQGEVSEKVINRLSKAQDTLVPLLNNYREDFNISRHNSKREINKEKYDLDVSRVARHISGVDPYVIIEGRKLHSTSLGQQSRDIIETMNLHKLKYWLVDRYSVMKDQPYYKY